MFWLLTYWGLSQSPFRWVRPRPGELPGELRCFAFAIKSTYYACLCYGLFYVAFASSFQGKHLCVLHSVENNGKLSNWGKFIVTETITRNFGNPKFVKYTVSIECWGHSRVSFVILSAVPRKVLFYVKIHVKLPQVFTILREYSRNVRSAKFHEKY